ncbi:MAG: hypothetical protein UT20_C0039G0010 [Candidatus Levybacteria bacterium GW2011_GWA1_39_11]|nr:MAG: hypothetical protein UT20_C0039G0010 [Candidatus Levybacteria bacterium GW2011_GWA1_39_11]
MGKKTLIIFSVITIMLIIFLILFVFSSNKKGEKGLKLPAPTRVVPTRVDEKRQPTPLPDKIYISGVEVKNFYKNPKRIDESKDVFIVEGAEYSIVFLSPFNHFKISILKSPFKETREKAEQEFINILGITKAQSCKLSVTESSPLAQSSLTAPWKRSYQGGS